MRELVSFYTTLKLYHLMSVIFSFCSPSPQKWSLTPTLILPVIRQLMRWEYLMFFLITSQRFRKKVWCYTFSMQSSKDAAYCSSSPVIYCCQALNLKLCFFSSFQGHCNPARWWDPAEDCGDKSGQEWHCKCFVSSLCFFNDELYILPRYRQK